MTYELPHTSFLKNIGYVRTCLIEKYGNDPKLANVVKEYNSEITLAGNSIMRIKDVLSRYLALLNEEVTVDIVPEKVEETTTKKRRTKKNETTEG